MEVLDTRAAFSQVLWYKCPYKEPCYKELAGWQVMNSGHGVYTKSTTGIAFLAKADLKVDFSPISSRVVTLILQWEMSGLVYWAAMPLLKLPKITRLKKNGKNLKNSVRSIPTRDSWRFQLLNWPGYQRNRRLFCGVKLKHLKMG